MLRDKKKEFRFSVARRGSVNAKSQAATESKATEEVSALLDKFEENRTYLLDFNTKLKKEIRTLQAHVEDGKRVGESLVSFHQKYMQGAADPVLVSCLEKTRDFQLNLYDLMSRLQSTLENRVVNPLIDCTRDDTTVKNTKKNFQKARSAYELVLIPSKKKASEQEVTGAKDAFLQAGNEALNTLKDTNQEMEFLLLQAFCDYWDGYHEYTTKAAKWVGNIRPAVEEYRTHLQKARAEYKQKQIARSSVNTFKAAADSKVFGVPLQELITREQTDIPIFIDKTIKYILKTSTQLEGVFRISAMKSSLKEITDRIDKGENVDYSDLPDPHIVPGLLKQFLRELPEPLLTFNLYPLFLKANSIDNEEGRLAEMKRLLGRLPKVNRDVFKQLLYLLQQIAYNEEVTKMGPSNLSTVIGPNILYDKEINPATMVEDMENANAIVVTYIAKYNDLFKVSTAVQAAKENDLNSLKALVQQGQSVDDADEDGLTCIHYAALRANIEMTNYLVQKGANVNAADVSGKTALMYACKDNFQSKVIAQALVSAGADVYASANGKTALDYAELISSDFHAVLLDAFQSRNSDASEPAPAAAVPEPAPEPVAEVPAPVVEKVPEPVKAVPEPVQPVAKPVEVKAPEPEPEPVKAPEPQVPKETPEQIAERAKAKAAALLQQRQTERQGGRPVNEDAIRAADRDVEDIIYERVHTLQSLVSGDIPLPSVYSILNINELTEAATALVKAAVYPEYGPNEISTLNTALQATVGALKNLFGVVKKFASLFNDEEKKEILSGTIMLQDATRNLIACVKELNGKPDSASAKDTLTSIAKQLTDTLYKFFKYCEIASLEYVETTTQTAAADITRILETSGAPSKDDLEDSCKAAALSCLKLSQLLKAAQSRSVSENIQVSLGASISIIERSTLELINDGKKTWAQGIPPSDDMHNLTKKILLEFRQVASVLSKEIPANNLSLADQAQAFRNLNQTAVAIVERLNEANFPNDLDKALVVQMRLITRTLSELSGIEQLPLYKVIGAAQTVVDCLKKVKIGITSMEAKSRDQSLNRKLKIWGETLQHYMFLARLAASGHVLGLPLTAEIPLSTCVQATTAHCIAFFENLLQLRAE